MAATGSDRGSCAKSCVMCQAHEDHRQQPSRLILV